MPPAEKTTAIACALEAFFTRSVEAQFSSQIWLPRGRTWFIKFVSSQRYLHLCLLFIFFVSFLRIDWASICIKFCRALIYEYVFSILCKIAHFFDAYASLIDRESTGVLLAKSKKKNRLIDVDIPWSSCINKLKIGFRVFFAFANLRNIGVSTGLLKPTNDKYIKYFSSVCACDARRCKASATDFSF